MQKEHAVGQFRARSAPVGVQQRQRRATTLTTDGVGRQGPSIKALVA